MIDYSRQQHETSEALRVTAAELIEESNLLIAQAKLMRERAEVIRKRIAAEPVVAPPKSSD
jgi:hypothetical protein